MHTAEHVATVVNELNTRPRKTLGYATPSAQFRSEARRRPGSPVSP